MTLADLFNKIFCHQQLQIMCIVGGKNFELACWCLGAALAMYALYKWREGPSYTKTNRLDGKVVIVTGCNTGIGKETALEMAKRGARVYMACRNFDKCEKARREIVNLSGNTNVLNSTLDLSSLQSVREFAEKFLQDETRLDILINNAGVLSTTRKLTQDGFEEHFGVNHLGHFLLTNLLLDRLKSSAPSRIVVLSSVAYLCGNIQKDDLNSEKYYNRFLAYGQSKLANILFTRKLAKILKDSKVTVNCVHPGLVQSEIARNNPTLRILTDLLSRFVFRSTKSGAQTGIFLALDPDIEGATGEYYDCMKVKSVALKARDDSMAEWLWQESEKMVGLKPKN